MVGVRGVKGGERVTHRRDCPRRGQRFAHRRQLVPPRHRDHELGAVHPPRAHRGEQGPGVGAPDAAG